MDEQQGEESTSDGEVYKGSFKDGKRSGEGIAKKISGEEYTGTWKEGLRDGFGYCLYADGVENYQVGNTGRFTVQILSHLWNGFCEFF